MAEKWADARDVCMASYVGTLGVMWESLGRYARTDGTNFVTGQRAVLFIWEVHCKRYRVNPASFDSFGVKVIVLHGLQ